MATRTLTRADIIDQLVRTLDLPRQTATSLLEETLESMIKNLVSEGEMKISSFGSFNVRQKGKRIGRNPKTGQEAVISPRKVLTFRPAQHLRDAVEKQKS